MMFAKKKYKNEIAEFAHRHKKLLFIVADPKTDEIFVTYNDKIAGGRIKSAKGDKTDIVGGVLKSASFERNIDDFLIGLAEVIGVKKLKHANNFLQFLDGALFNITNKAHKKAKAKKSGKVE